MPKKSTKQKITKDMSLAEVMNKYPQTANVFMSHGMHCFGCSIANNETIEDGAKAHGIKIPKLLDDLNIAASQKLDAVEEKISNIEKEEVKEEKPSFFKRLFGRK